MKNSIEKCDVTVVCITYNHEKYLAEALESFCTQETNFKYKVFVGEDLSPDNTRKVLEEYAEKYPDLIVPFYREKNMGAQRNLIDMCSKAMSPYIAFCEGDDYWIDSKKLQKQYDYMEQNKHLSACFHNTEIRTQGEWYLDDFYLEDNQGRMLIPEGIPNYISKKEMDMRYYIKYGPAHTSSIFYRWNYEREIPEWYYNHIFGDHSLMMIQVGDGKIGFLPDVMSVYRRSEVGIIFYNSKEEHFLKTRADWVSKLLDLKEYFRQNYGSYCEKEIIQRIVTETINYFNVVSKYSDPQLAVDFILEYPDAARYTYNSLLTSRKYNGIVKKRIGKVIYEKLLNSKSVGKQLTQGRQLYLEKNKRKKWIQTFKLNFEYSRRKYKKRDDLTWIFATDNTNDRNSAKNLFEYVSNNHKEIRAVWLTNSSKEALILTRKGYEAYVYSAEEAKNLIIKAGVGIIDGFKLDVFGKKKMISGMKIVQLWKHYSLEDYSRRIKDKNSLVRASADILPEKGESLFKKIGKSIKRFNEQPTRELFEEYYMMCSIGSVERDYYSKIFKLPKHKFFLTNYPNAKEENLENVDNRILYVPSTEKDEYGEMIKAKEFCDSLDAIVNMLREKELVLDLCIPSSFRKIASNEMTKNVTEAMPIRLVERERAYSRLQKYRMVIGDFDSIMYDAIAYDIPLISMVPDLEGYAKQNKYNKYPYDYIVPSLLCKTWGQVCTAIEDETFLSEEIKEHAKRSKDLLYRGNQIQQNASESIVREIQRRMSMSDKELKKEFEQQYTHDETDANVYVTSQDYTPEVIQRVKDVSLQMMVEVAKILDSHGLKYMIAHGTLLGAVRHGGFIPWDDDFDIHIFEDDYEEALKVLRDELPKSDFIVHDKLTDPIYWPKWAKVRDLHSDTIATMWEIDNKFKYRGICIDLLRVNELTRGKREWKKKRKLLNQDIKSCKKSMKKLGKKNKIKKKIKLCCLYAQKLFGKLMSILDRKKILYGNLDTIIEVEYNPKNIWPLKKYKFENYEFWGPNNADGVLTDLYGNYMELPQIYQRQPHYGKVVFLDDEKKLMEEEKLIDKGTIKL